MAEKNNSLMRRPSSAVEKAAPGAKRILSGMVADTLAVAYAEDVETVFTRGMIYFNGDGVPRDYTKAAKWFLKAAKREHVKAKFYLGHCYTYGIPRDRAEAFKWYNEAAKLGDAEAQFTVCLGYKFGNVVAKDSVEAFKWCRKAAEQGFAQAQNELGHYYKEGIGIQQDYLEAVKWYRKAANQGFDFAQLNLGDCYEYGIGVQQDYAKAVQWYRKASEQGFSVAHMVLGFIYCLGEGMPLTQDLISRYEHFGEIIAPDFCEAYKFFKLNSLSSEYIAALTAKMTPTEIEEGERRYREFISSRLLT